MNTGVSMLLIPFVTFFGVLLGAYGLSGILFYIAVSIFFTSIIRKKSILMYLIFGISACFFDAYNNFIVGVTFLAVILAIDLFLFVISLTNNPNYLETYRMYSFIIFIFIFNLINVIFHNIFSKSYFSIFDSLINMLISTILYAIYVFYHHKQRVKSKYLKASRM